MADVRAFLIGALKIALAAVLAVGLLAVLRWGAYRAYERWEAAKDAPLAVPRPWPERVVEPLDNAKLSLSTVWRDGAMHYKFTVDGYPRAVGASRKRGSADVLGNAPKFTLKFLDQHGFKLFEHEIPSKQLTRVVDRSGNRIGMSARDQIYVSADMYRRAASWRATWNFASSER